MPKTSSTFRRSSATTDLLEPQLHDLTRGGVRLVTDAAARASGLLVFFTDRNGGASRAPYDSLNLGNAVGDDPAAVAANRTKVAEAAGMDPRSVMLVRQVHGCRVVAADEAAAGDADVEGDAILVTAPGAVAGVLTADCVPVVVAGAGGVVVVHAGWRGLVAGVLEQAVAALGDARAAWVGPSIAACCYRVGVEVVDSFAAAGLPVAASDRVDPRAAAVAALRRLEVPAVAVSSSCTSCDERYFSHRRDGVTGRQGGFAALLP